MTRELKHIGVVVPPANVTCEGEFPKFLPEGVALLFNRMSRPGSKMTAEATLAMMETLERAAADLAAPQPGPEVIVCACTSGTFLAGPAEHGSWGRRIHERTGVAGITTATAVLEALTALRARRVFMISPYPEPVHRVEVGFLEFHGFKVVADDTFACPDEPTIRAVTSRQVAERLHGHRTVIRGCDAVFASCTALHTMDRIEEMERDLGVPVVSSNSATLWAALRQIGADTRNLGAGRLYERDLTHAFLAAT
ncbi:MAG: aspartate/glutamate racemase family protein [Proteobacteria bacterium]|nr:aspartate/glutamate racemase family protein [Pseudomonadota bacterium]